MEGLSQVVDAYALWKRGLMLEITRYRNWLEHGALNSDEINEQLNHALQVLITDRITLAFLGEFSRGKTELINSLFFSDYSQRILPSQAGRTTMCPTELFYDQQSKQSSISLLPVETRNSPLRLDQLKQDKSLWLTIPLDVHKPDSMVRALAQVAQRKAVTEEEALALGFAPDKLEASKNPGYVWIPAWRHALINYDHPLLRQGLRVLDTPGLNALGSEPELTISMLPSAQAIVMMLSADTGVTASEMQTWQEQIQPLRDKQNVDVFIALNKIDMLWDDLAGFSATEKNLQQVVESTAKQLKITAQDVLPVSAKQGLLGRVRGDQRLLARSELERFERTLSERLLERKERLIENSIVSQVVALINNSKRVLKNRQNFAIQEYSQLKNKQMDSAVVLQQMTNKAKQQHRGYQQQMLTLKTNQQVMEHQGETLNRFLSPEQVEEHLKAVYKKINSSLAIFGLRSAAEGFFKAMRDDFKNFMGEAGIANQRIQMIYEQHNLEHPDLNLVAPQIVYSHYRKALSQLETSAKEYSFSLRHVLTGQLAEGRRYYMELVQEAVAQHNKLRQEVTQWCNAALTPLMQQSLENKQMLENQIEHLKDLAQKSQKSGQRYSLLNKYHEDLTQRMSQLDQMLHNMMQPAPTGKNSTVTGPTP